MKMVLNKPKIKIYFIYVVFTFLYYGVSSALFFSKKEVGTNLLQSLLIALGDVFFWVSVHLYFAAAVIISTVIGMIVSKKRGNTEAFDTFRNICIFIIIVLTVLTILANL